MAGLISYMEKKKSELRKLKRVFDRKKKQEVSRVINQQFNTVPGRVFPNLSEMLKRDPENERPRYKDPGKRGRDDLRMFENIEEASGFCAPGPDKITNFWWKRASTLHEGVVESFKEVSKSDEDYPEWRVPR